MRPRCLLHHAQGLGQPQRNHRYIGDQAKERQHGQQPRPYRHRQLGDAHLGDAGGDVQVEADRRMAHADFHVDHDQDAEVHRVDAQLHRHREQDRREDQHDRRRLHHVTGQQQDHVHRQQEGDRAEAGVDQRTGHRLRNAFAGHQEGEQHRVGDDVQQHRRHAGRIEQHLRHLLQRQVLVDEHGDDEGIDGGHGGGFGRREDAGVDAAHDDDDQQQAPDRLAEGLPALAPGRFRLTRVVELLGAIPGDAAQRCRQRPAGQDAGHEQGADRGIGRHRVHHHHDRRRDQDAERAGVADDAGRKILRVAGRDHAGDHGTDRAEHGLGEAGVLNLGDDEGLVLLLDLHDGREGLGDFALGAVDGHGGALDVDLDLLGNQNGLFAITSVSSTFGWQFQANDAIWRLSPLNVEYVRLYDLSQTFKDQLSANPFLRNSFNQGFVLGNFNANFSRPQIRIKKRDNHVAGMRVNFEESGALFGRLKKVIPLFDKELFEYVKLDAEVKYQILKPSSTWARWVFRAAAGAGYLYDNDTSSMPFFKQFAGGGPNSMRAWPLRSIGPGASPADIRTGRNQFFSRSGDIIFETNAEYRYKILSIWPNSLILEGALFTDIGNVWNFRNKGNAGNDTVVLNFKNLYRDLSVSVGTGLRLDFVGLFMIRVDVGYRLKNPAFPYVLSNNGWRAPKISVANLFGRSDANRNWRYENINISLGIGYPFNW